MRAEFINDWSSKSSKKVIKRRLNQYRAYVKRRFWKNMERRTKRTRTGRDYSKLSKAMILGKTRYKWKKVKAPGKVISNNRFYVREFRMYNIDQLFRPRTRTQNVIVRNPEGKNLKLMYKNWFVVMRGEQVGDETIFRNICQNEPLVILGTEGLPDGSVNFGFLETEAVEKVFEVTNYRSVSKEILAKKLRTLALKVRRT